MSMIYLIDVRKILKIFLERRRNYQPNIKLTVEMSPARILDTKLNYVNVIYRTMVQRKVIKLLIHWSSKALKRNANFTNTMQILVIATDQ